MQSVLNDDDEDLFHKLLENFLNQSAIAGVQPKVLAPLFDKINLTTKEYIVKSFSSEFPHLGENEYFCMRAVGYAGIKTPNFWLSENKKLFIVEKFTYQKDLDQFYGFEEFCVLFGFTKEKKYSGSYEKIAKSITAISTQRDEDFLSFFKIIVMSYLLKNGDAHLKNFGIMYNSDKTERFLAPAYDIVNTAVYLPKDKPALTLNGKKIWNNREELIGFGIQYCFLDEKIANSHFDICIDAVERIIEEMEYYIEENSNFREFGEKFLKILRFSLEKNLGQSYRDISDAIL